MLRRLAHPAAENDSLGGPLKVVVAPIRAVLQPIVAGLGDLVPVRLAAGDDADPEDVIARLVDIGYARVEMVSKRGELAVRGGLLDVFPPTEEHPLRVEFFGDTVEEIRVFKVADQRSAGQAEHGLWAPPCRELLLTPSVRARAKELAAKHPGVSEILGKIADGITVEGMEAFSSVLADRMDLLLDHLPLGARRARLRPGADQDAGHRAGRDQPGVPRGVLGERRLRRRGAGRPRRVGLPADREDPRDGGRARHRVVDPRAVRCDRRSDSAGGALPKALPASAGTAPSAPRTRGRNRRRRVSRFVRDHH